MARLALLLSFALGLTAAAAQEAIRYTATAADLAPIGAERRADLAANPHAKSATELNALIPETEVIELDNAIANAAPGETLRVIAWNTERGRHWRDCVRLIQEHPDLQNPDVILLGEMDLGMARSANEHTTREMALALGMNYAYGVEFLELTGGEKEERERHPGENSLGYHGNAILSRYPMKNVRMLRFPGIEYWYANYQKRLGGRNALLAEIVTGGKTLTLCSTHLESVRGETALRLRQGEMILREIEEHGGGMPVIFGGDLNARPDEPVIGALRSAGFLVDEANDLATFTAQRLQDGRVTLWGAHIDYLAVRGLDIARDPSPPAVVVAAYPPGPGEKLLGDHAAVVVNVKTLR